MHRRRHGGLRWQLLPDFDPLLSPVLASQGELVKQTALTLVTRHHVGDRVFYIKRYRYGAQKNLLPAKFFFRAPKSRREWKWATLMRQRGVAVVPHLARGERWSWHGLLESILITEGLPGYAPLKSNANPAAPELQFALGQFLRRVHDAGVLYLDLAPQNVLYSDGEQAFRFIDIDKVAYRQKLSAGQRLSNITLLAVRQPLTARFYDGYGRDFAFDAEQIAEQAKRDKQKVMTRLSRRWRQHLHEIAVEQVRGLRWHVRTAQRNEKLRQIMENPEAFTGDDTLIAQRFSFSGARQAYQKAYRLELLGVSAARPVAVGERRILGLCVESYFVSRTC
jgi:hypothetical protein